MENREKRESLVLAVVALDTTESLMHDIFFPR